MRRALKINSVLLSEQKVAGQSFYLLLGALGHIFRVCRFY